MIGLMGLERQESFVRVLPLIMLNKYKYEIEVLQDCRLMCMRNTVLVFLVMRLDESIIIRYLYGQLVCK